MEDGVYRVPLFPGVRRTKKKVRGFVYYVVGNKHLYVVMEQCLTKLGYEFYPSGSDYGVKRHKPFYWNCGCGEGYLIDTNCRRCGKAYER